MKKILFIGDSNCLPRYNTIKKDIIKIEDLYIYQLKKKFQNFHFEQITLGGITTPQLINYVVPYYVDWEPDIILMHTGINDTKSQLASGKVLNLIYKSTKLFNISKKNLKSKILYNPSYLKYSSRSKTDIETFEKSIDKIKLLFNKSKIYWLEVYSDEKLDTKRPNTKKNIDKLNLLLKKKFEKNLIKMEDLKKKKYFTSDGFHLNCLGHKILSRKIANLIKIN